MSALAELFSEEDVKIIAAPYVSGGVFIICWYLYVCTDLDFFFFVALAVSMIFLVLTLCFILTCRDMYRELKAEKPYEEKSL